MHVDHPQEKINMKKSSIVTLSLFLAIIVGCGKKEEKALRVNEAPKESAVEKVEKHENSNENKSIIDLAEPKYKILLTCNKTILFTMLIGEKVLTQQQLGYMKVAQLSIEKRLAQDDETPRETKLTYASIADKELEAVFNKTAEAQVFEKFYNASKTCIDLEFSNWKMQ